MFTKKIVPLLVIATCFHIQAQQVEFKDQSIEEKSEITLNAQLMIAAQEDRHDVGALLAQGAVFNAVDGEGYSALHYAAAFGHLGTMWAIIRHYEKTEARKTSSETAEQLYPIYEELHLAAFFAHEINEFNWESCNIPTRKYLNIQFFGPLKKQISDYPPGHSYWVDKDSFHSLPGEPDFRYIPYTSGKADYTYVHCDTAESLENRASHLLDLMLRTKETEPGAQFIREVIELLRKRAGRIVSSANR